MAPSPAPRAPRTRPVPRAPRTRPVPRTRIATTAAALLCGSALVGAATAATACSRGDAPAPAAAAATAFAEPVTIDNCGLTETFDAPPQRVIAMNGHVAETLVSMGAADQMIGTAYSDNPPPPDIAAEYNAIPVLSDTYPTAEQVFDAEPDFVVAGMSSAFNEKDGRGRETLADHGIPTFLFSEWCGDGFTGLDVLDHDFTQLGEVLGRSDAAQALIDRITDGMDGIRDTVRASGAAPVPTFFYDSGEDQPYTVGSGGVGQVIADYAGAQNITAPDSDKTYFTSDWETIGERAPEAIVVLDYGDTSAQDKIDFLKSQPIMQTTPAVQNNRFTVVPLADMFESARMVPATDTIARGLHPDAFTEQD